MKDVAKQDLPEVSGGVTNPGGCTTPVAYPIMPDYPRMPAVPLTDEMFVPEADAFTKEPS